MNPEGVDSLPRTIPSMLVAGWTSAFVVGMPRAVAISLVSDQELRQDITISFFGRHLSGQFRPPVWTPRWPDVHVLLGRPPSNGICESVRRRKVTSYQRSTLC